MSNVQRLTILSVLAVGGVTGYSFYDRTYHPIPRSEPTDIREAERSRRAQRPSGDPKREFGVSYDRALNGWRDDIPSHPKPAAPRPPTSCRSVEIVPNDPDRVSGPHSVHQMAVLLFQSQSGFGFVRMGIEKNGRDIIAPSPTVDRVELVSLLTDYEPSVYVLDEMATPPLARQAQRRPLDDFERLGLDAVRRGQDLVWTRKAPTRMFGAIRAQKLCLDCHAAAKEGDLLGAFTYYLDTPVDRMTEVGVHRRP